MVVRLTKQESQCWSKFCATVLNSLGGSSSGVHAFLGCKDKSCFYTPAVLILGSGISGNGDCPKSS